MKPMFSPDGTNIIYQPGNIVMLKYFSPFDRGNQVNISKSLGDDIIHWDALFSRRANNFFKQ